MNRDIVTLIKSYEQKGDFTHVKVDDSMIEKAEELLQVKLPNQYIAFLKEYGHGGIGGVETIGIGLTGRLIFADVTLQYRDEDLPDNLVVIENDDEWLECIDTNTEKIVSWDMDGFIKNEYDCFDEYLLDQIKDAIENM